MEIVADHNSISARGNGRNRRYVHVSFDVVEKFIPRVPKDRAVGEDNAIPRICVTDSVLNSLNAMVDAGKTLRLMEELKLPLLVHAYFLEADSIWDTDTVQKYVPDAKVNHEMWVMTSPRKVQRVDYLVEEPCMVEINENHVEICHANLKQVRYADNVENLARKFEVNAQRVRKCMGKYGFSQVICNIGPELIALCRKEREKVA